MLLGIPLFILITDYETVYRKNKQETTFNTGSCVYAFILVVRRSSQETTEQMRANRGGSRGVGVRVQWVRGWVWKVSRRFDAFTI